MTRAEAALDGVGLRVCRCWRHWVGRSGSGAIGSGVQWRNTLSSTAGADLAYLRFLSENRLFQELAQNVPEVQARSTIERQFDDLVAELSATERQIYTQADDFFGSNPNGGKGFARGGNDAIGNDEFADLVGACPSNSFSGDTLVQLADGDMLPIADVQVGDQVLAYDFGTGETVVRDVTATLPHTDWLLEAHLSDGSVMSVTEDHRFWSITDTAWVELQDLDTTDVLLTPDGATVTVDWLDWDSGETASAFDLTVEGEHNFFVAGDELATPTLVHNQGAPAPWCGIALTDDVFRKLDSAITTEEVRTSVRAAVDGLVLSGRLEGAERLLTYVSRFDEDTVARMMQNANIDRAVTNTVLDEKVEYAFGITRFESRASNGPDDLKRALTNRDEPIEFRRVGEPEFDVYEPFNANRITDIDRFSPNFDELESGAQVATPQLVEEKSASFANDIGAWVDSNIFAKYDAYSRSRPLIPGFEESEILFDFSDAGVSLDPPFRTAVEQAMSTLNASDPYGVRVVFP